MNVIETHGLRKVFRTRRGAVEAVRSVDLSVQADEGATGRENLLLQGRLYGLGKKEAQARAEVLISTLQLNTFAGRVVKIYSGGQRRRLDLALGMVHRPRLLFLDEPTTGLDPQSRSALWEEVRRLRDGAPPSSSPPTTWTRPRTATGSPS